MIDQLPLDVFDDANPKPQAASAPAPPAEATIPAADAEPAASAHPMTATHQRVYDVIAVVGLALGLGIAFRVVWLGGLLPIANFVIALIGYKQLRPEHRGEYTRRMESLRERLEQERAVAALQPSYSLPRPQRWLYDGLGIVIIGAVSGLIAFLLGFDGWLPVPWLFLAVIGAGVYFWPARGYHQLYYMLAERAQDRLIAAWNDINPP